MTNFLSIKCEANYCIYNRDNKCLCDSVTINSAGMCDGYMLVALDHDFLEMEKKRHLEDVEARHKEFSGG